jgi:hypothetical protein
LVATVTECERLAIIAAVRYRPRKATAPRLFPAVPPCVGIATGVMRAEAVFPQPSQA